MGIRRLARELNLSIGTVSRALNDQPDVKAETRERVKKAALKSGYVPNQSGRSLRKGTTGMVAALLPTIGPCQNSDGGMLRMLEGARRTLRANELDLIILLRGPDEDPMANLQRIVSRRIADALIITRTVPFDPRLTYLSESGVSHVTLGRSDGHSGSHWVDFDYESATRESVRLFVRDGHRRIALVQSGLGLSFERIIAREFRVEAASAGLPETAIRVVESGPGDVVGDILSGPGDRPTAVLTSHESMASLLYAELPARGLKIGADIAVVSMSPTIDSETLVPPLSCYDCDLDNAGAALGDRIVMLLAGKAEEATPALMPMRFVARESHLSTTRAVRA